MLCRCGATLSGICIETYGVVSAYCASGHRVYVFKTSDGWETQDQRQKRLRITKTCTDCKSKFHIAAEPYGTANYQNLCNPCLDRRERETKWKSLVKTGKKSDGWRVLKKRSYWHTFATWRSKE